MECDGRPLLRSLHSQSLGACVEWPAAGCKEYCARRGEIICWLVTAFDEMQLRDEWLVASVCLLDRIAVAWQRDQLANGEGVPLVEMLAVVCLALKFSSAEPEMHPLELKGIILKLAQAKQPRDLLYLESMWKKIIQAEWHSFRLVRYRVAVPTVLDLANCLAMDVDAQALRESTVWPGADLVQVTSRNGGREQRRLFAILSAFLAELAVANLHLGLPNSDAPPLVLAIVAVRLALQAFSKPPPEAAWQSLRVAEQLLAVEEPKLLQTHTAWLQRLCISKPADAVVLKWQKRGCGWRGFSLCPYRQPTCRQS